MIEQEECVQIHLFTDLVKDISLKVREVGEGIRMGNTCKPIADSCQCMAKTTTIL